MDSINFNVENAQNSSRRGTPRALLGDGSVGIQCVRFDPLDRYLAAGCEDGSIRIFNAATGRLSFTLNQRRLKANSEEEQKMPTTCIRWRPVGNTTKTKNVLISVHADGSVQHWHVTSGKMLHKLYMPTNQLFCTDYNPDGTLFAIAGKDLIVRVYDETTKTPVVEFEPGGAGSGHSNRIFAVKFYTQEPNVLISGGWDDTIQVWDMREGAAVKVIYGPHICGDALDIKNGEILAGSWRDKNQLQYYYLGDGERILNIDWDGGVGIRKGPEPCWVYSCQFSKHDDGETILAGGSKSNEMRFFDYINYSKPFGAVMGMEHPVFSVDFSYSGTMAAAGCTDGYIRLVNINKTS